jgi:beta-glucosidase
MSLVDEAGQARLEPGDFRVTVGGCSPGARGLALGAPPAVQATFVV